jgi:hypothetical protein
MVAKGKPRGRRLRFELSWSAVAGLAVVAFCLFLWMFLLGVWAGQSLLRPPVEESTTSVTEPAPAVIRAERKVVKSNHGPAKPD